LSFLLTTLLPFLIVFSILVLVHELGHFFFARMFGVEVEEFGLGIPPRIWGKKYKGTMYSINAIPLGGFVRLLGEDGSEIEETEEQVAKKKAGNFALKPIWQRAIILTAGVLMNFLLAWVLFTGLYQQGYLNSPKGLQVTQVVEGSAAADAGILSNDVITKAVKSDGTSISLPTLTDVIRANPDELFTLSILRDVETITFTLKPKLDEHKTPLIGVVLDFVKDETRHGVVESIGAGLQTNFGLVSETFFMLGKMVRTIFTTFAIPKEVTGPVGIIKITSDAAQLGLPALLYFMAIISVNLAVLNIMPFPALDGGRLLVLGIEAVLRRKLPVKWEMAVHSTGFILLMIFIIAVTFQDITRIFFKAG